MSPNNYAMEKATWQTVRGWWWRKWGESRGTERCSEHRWRRIGEGPMNTGPGSGSYHHCYDVCAVLVGRMFKRFHGRKLNFMKQPLQRGKRWLVQKWWRWRDLTRFDNFLRLWRNQPPVDAEKVDMKWKEKWGWLYSWTKKTWLWGFPTIRRASKAGTWGRRK